MGKRNTKRAVKVHEETVSSPSSHARSEENDISLDFSPIKEFFKKTDVERLVLWSLLLFVILLVTYIRMLPASLPVAEDWADNSIRTQIRSQYAQQVNQQFPNLPQVNKDQRIDELTNEYIQANEVQLATARTQVAEQFRGFFRYAGDDGKQYTYLGDLDSYFWLRYARNYLETGMTCDSVTESGECRDDYPLAPWGVTSSRNPSLHVFAIAYLHEFLTIFNPGRPLLATSFLIPVLVGILGIIPAFFIGRKLAGNVGGFFASILASIHPLGLSRSMGSDNDAWNITLPLFALWMAIESLEAKTLTKRIIFSLLTVVAIAIHAATWAAWWFGYLIILFAIVGCLVFRGLSYGIQQRNWRVWDDANTVAVAIVLAIFYIGTFFAVTIVDSSIDYYWSLPLSITKAESGLQVAVGSEYWPNVLTTVAELNKASFNDVISQMGGPLFFFGCLIGLLLMTLPRTIRWRWMHWAVLFGGSAFAIYLTTNGPSVTRVMALALLALPIGAAIILQMFREDADTHICASIIILAWFSATVFAAFSGVRFIMLMIPAYAISFGVLAGRVYDWSTQYLTKEIPVHRYITCTVVFLILAMTLIQPVRAGYATAYSFAPTIDDAWWDALTKIRVESQPDAIINSWWDFGHWFKYVADRRVSADGTTQHTHVPRWLGLALVVPDEKQSVAVLRMLDCGSDVYPAIEGDYGAYGRILKRIPDSIKAQDMVIALMGQTPGVARKTLETAGFTAQEQDDILASLKCSPPENFFITSGDMVGKAGVWAHFGLWDFRKAYVASNARDPTKPRDVVINDFVQNLGYTQEEAERLYFDAKALRNEGEINAFAAPWPGYSSGWMGCAQISDPNVTKKDLACQLGIGANQQGNRITQIDGMIFNGSKPNNSILVYGVWQNGQRIGGIENGTPDVLFVADDVGFHKYDFDNPTSPGLGILVDQVNNRVLIGDPLLLQSTFTHLFYLDGRYAKYYKKFDDRTSASGIRILTWKVDWEAFIRDSDGIASPSSRATARIVEASAKNGATPTA